MNGKLTPNEEKALRFYIGDVSGNDSFFGDPKAYVVLNSLFFSGIRTETARASEGKYLNPAIIADIPRLLDFFDSLFSIFRKSATRESITSYRVERLTDYLVMREERSETVSLTSTSKTGFLNAYRDRRWIALMRFILPENTPFCIDVGETLSHYAKPDETEILIAPFVKTVIEEIPLSDTEMRITDCDGNPPQISCKVKLLGTERRKSTMPELTDCKAGQRVYKALNNGKKPDSESVSEYSHWKMSLQSILRNMI